MNFDVNSETVISNTESVEICKIIMEDILGDLLDNLEALEAEEVDQSELPAAEIPKPFFKTLSFYDDPDDDPMLPFESFFETEVPDGSLTEMPSEFTQPFCSSTEALQLGGSEGNVIVTAILDAILDAVPPRKIATVHPFSLNNKDEESETPEPAPALRLAGFATDPAASATTGEAPEVRPTIKFANFAVDPGSGGSGLKLANFAKDPDATSTSWHTRDGAEPLPAQSAPPPLTHRPELPTGGLQLFSPPVGPAHGPASRSSPQLPALTRAPSSAEVGATPPPATPAQNLACFGHFERELEYRYCFRSDSILTTRPLWIIAATFSPRNGPLGLLMTLITLPQDHQWPGGRSPGLRHLL
jgi:hypothetical protein